MPLRPYRSAFDRLYARYTRREFLSPDPIAFLHRYPDWQDREVVALIASSLAYGRAVQISRSVERVLACMPSPGQFVREASVGALCRAFADFRHRFTTGRDLADLLLGVQRVAERHGSLHGCFLTCLGRDDETVVPALSAFVDRLVEARGGRPSYLLPSPRRGSACKRLNLFLRWMVRQDAVDLGGWHGVPASKLVVPLDTHMHRIGQAFGLTRRKQADLKAAMELTTAFRRLAPHDPVRYDFALTRLGIRHDADVESFLRECGVAERTPVDGRRG